MFLKNAQNVRLLYGTKFLFLPPLSKQEGEQKAVFSEEKNIAITPDVESPNAEPETTVPENPAFISPPQVEVSVSPVVPEPIHSKTESLFLKGVRIDWKKRATAKFFVIVSESVFSNRMLMILLREFIRENEIPFEWISFGVYQDGATNWETETMPLNEGILFSKTLSFTEAPEKMGQKWIVPAPDLLQIAEKIPLQNAFRAILKDLKSRI